MPNSFKLAAARIACTRVVSISKLAMFPTLTLNFPSGRFPFPEDLAKSPVVVIDSDRLEAPRPLSDHSWTARFKKRDGKWTSPPQIPIAPFASDTACKAP